MNPNIRKNNETQKQFRERRAEEAKAEKVRAKGRLLWDSSRRGTYVRAQHGPLS